MTEKELRYYLEKTGYENEWSGNEWFIWVPFGGLAEFAELICPETEYEIMGNFQHDCICFDLVPICEIHGLEVEL